MDLNCPHIDGFDSSVNWMTGIIRSYCLQCGTLLAVGDLDGNVTWRIED